MQRYIFSSTLTSSKPSEFSFYASSAKCEDAFHIALTENPKKVIKQRYNKTLNSLSYYPSQHRSLLHFNTSKIPVNRVLKNYYINPSKTSINEDKNTHKKQVCNQQKIN